MFPAGSMATELMVGLPGLLPVASLHTVPGPSGTPLVTNGRLSFVAQHSKPQLLTELADHVD